MAQPASLRSITSSTRYIGRFAPSPTGPLHFGSLLGALASFLDARAHQGTWRVRVEDIDPPREVAGATPAILDCLLAHGLRWDGEVCYQSRRAALYREAIERLLAEGAAFYCTCSRTALAQHGGIYAGRCRECRQLPDAPYAVRLRVDAGTTAFDDRIQGPVAQDLAREVGDFVLFRKEGWPAYQLAVVVDDAAQGITHIVRGSDLLDSTPRQLFLQRRLGLPTPQYAHIPVIANAAGQKLSKQTFAPALDNGAALQNLLAALDFLGQPAPDAAHRQSVDALLTWAIAHWRLEMVPRRMQILPEELPASCWGFAG